MDRRGFLKAILAAAVAPYVVTTAGVLMRGRGVIVPRLMIAGAPMDHAIDALQYAVHRGGKSWFMAQEVVRRARQGNRVAVFGVRQDHLRSLIEQAAEPLEVPNGIVYVPWDKPQGKTE